MSAYAHADAMIELWEQQARRWDRAAFAVPVAESAPLFANAGRFRALAAAMRRRIEECEAREEGMLQDEGEKLCR